MKKSYYLIIPLLFIFLSSMGQNEVDALRYSHSLRNGTARYLSMGGAFGALGADMSALNSNPAGLGVYRRAEISFTPGFYNHSVQSTFLNNKIDDSRVKQEIDNIGIVFPVYRKTNSPWKSVNFGFSYNLSNNFESNIYMEGINNNSSMVNEFIYSANNSENWDPFYDELAWETYLMDYDTISGRYFGDFEEGTTYGQRQSKSIVTSGSMGEYTFSLGGNYGDNLYIGASFSLQKIDYKEDSKYEENDRDNKIDYFNWFRYGYSQETTGKGWDFKLGILYRPVDWLRLGASVHSPKYIKFKDWWNNDMETSIEDGEDPHYLDKWGENDSWQELTTPYKAIVSAAVVLKKVGIISVDYEFIDYSYSRLGSSSNDYFYTEENRAIREMYRKTGNLHIGAEYKFGDFSFRGGYAMYGSPYESDQVNADAFHRSISGGIGYRSNNFSLDLVIVNTSHEENYFLYYENPAILKSTTNRILATFGFRF